MQPSSTVTGSALDIHLQEGNPILENLEDQLEQCLPDPSELSTLSILSSFSRPATWSIMKSAQSLIDAIHQTAQLSTLYITAFYNVKDDVKLHLPHLAHLHLETFQSLSWLERIGAPRLKTISVQMHHESIPKLLAMLCEGKISRDLRLINIRRVQYPLLTPRNANDTIDSRHFTTCQPIVRFQALSCL